MTRKFWVNPVTSPEAYIFNMYFSIETLIELGLTSSPCSRWPCLSPNRKGQGSHFDGLAPGPHVGHKEREATWLQGVLGQRFSGENR